MAAVRKSERSGMWGARLFTLPLRNVSTVNSHSHHRILCCSAVRQYDDRGTASLLGGSLA